MTTLGNNVKITAPESARAGARAMFDAIGGKLTTPAANADVFALGETNVGFEYVSIDEALTPSQMQRAPWLELCVADVDGVTAKLAALGLPSLDYRDKTHPYFIGPGGFVFRLARARS